MKATSILLFLILAITCTVIAQDPAYQKFITQHYKLGMTKRDCKQKMDLINHLYYGNRCKDVNSVIAGPNKNLIKAVCDKGGEPYETPSGKVYRRSLQKFSVITCTRKGKTDQPPCEYRASDSLRKIVIDCNEDKLPVHYVEGHIISQDRI